MLLPQSNYCGDQEPLIDMSGNGDASGRAQVFGLGYTTACFYGESSVITCGKRNIDNKHGDSFLNILIFKSPFWHLWEKI